MNDSSPKIENDSFLDPEDECYNAYRTGQIDLDLDLDLENIDLSDLDI